MGAFVFKYTSKYNLTKTKKPLVIDIQFTKGF